MGDGRCKRKWIRQLYSQGKPRMDSELLIYRQRFKVKLNVYSSLKMTTFVSCCYRDGLTSKMKLKLN
jgi:hypothetical protein